MRFHRRASTACFRARCCGAAIGFREATDQLRIHRRSARHPCPPLGGPTAAHPPHASPQLAIRAPHRQLVNWGADTKPSPANSRTWPWWLSWGFLASRCLAYLVVAWMLPGGCLVRRHLRELPESCPSTQRVVRELFLEPATHLPLPTRAFLSVFPWPLLVWMVSGRLLSCFSGVA